MRYGAVRKVPKYEEAHPRFTEEQIYRELARKLVTEIPLGALKAVIKMRKEEPELKHEPSRYFAEINIEL